MDNTPEVLANAIAAAQGRLKSTLDVLRVEAKPRTILGKKMTVCQAKLRAAAYDEAGSLKIPVVAVAVAGALTLVGMITFFAKKR